MSVEEMVEGPVFELDAGLTLARLLGEGEILPELFDRLSARAQRLARGDGRREISCEDLRRACRALELERASECAQA